jgi:hypothetical protein
MLEAIIEWIKSKSYRCDHEWVLEHKMNIFENESSKKPHTTRTTYRCTKCCEFKQIEL